MAIGSIRAAGDGPVQIPAGHSPFKPRGSCADGGGPFSGPTLFVMNNGGQLLLALELASSTFDGLPRRVQHRIGRLPVDRADSVGRDRGGLNSLGVKVTTGLGCVGIC